MSVNALADHEVRAVFFNTECKNIDKLNFNGLAFFFINTMKDSRECTRIELIHMNQKN